MLELRELHAGWGRTVVVEGVSLTVAAGECVALLGRNGVGKTTLFEAVTSRARTQGGAVLLEGRDITALDTYAKARLGLGYVPQNREVFPSLTVDEHLRVARRPGPWDPQALYDLFPGLAARTRSLAGVLSGGEQQMLAIARALVGNPKVLLLDEPTEGLSPLIVEALSSAIRRIVGQGGLAVLLVEQRLDVALSVADRCIAMDRGRLVYEAPVAEVRADPEAVQGLLGVADEEPV